MGRSVARGGEPVGWGPGCPRDAVALAARLSGLRIRSLVKMLRIAPLPPVTKSPVMIHLTNSAVFARCDGNCGTGPLSILSR